MLPRTRLIAVLLTVIAGLFLAQYLRAWLSIPPPQAHTSDFAGTYAAATLWRGGHPALMYDEVAQQHVLRATGTPADHLDIPFENPPIAAVAASPLTSLPADTAYRVFSLLQIALLFAAIMLVMRAAPWPAGISRVAKVAVGAWALAGLGTGLLLIEGQWDGVLALSLGLAYAWWRRGAGAPAGFALGFAAAATKPHLILGLAAFAVGRRDWRALGGMLLGAAAAMALSLVFTGTTGTGAFVHALLKPSNNPLLVMQGLSGLFASWFGSSGLALGLTVVGSLGGAAAAAWLGAVSRRSGSFEPAFCGATVLTLLIALHLLGHDLTLLAPVLVAMFAWLATRNQLVRNGWPDPAAGAALLAWVALSFSSQLDQGNATLAPPGRVTPLVLCALAAACCWVVTRPDLSGARSGRSGALSSPALSPSAQR